MNTQLQAVIVKLCISQYSNTRQDPNITAGVKALHKLTGKAGKWMKYKLPDEALDPVRKAASAARQTHYDYTLPWEEGYALLPAKARTEYTDRMAEAKTAFNLAVDAFVEAYPGWVDQARLMHAGTFNERDYPEAGSVRNEFGFAITVYPMPAASHFDAELRGLYGEQLESHTEAKVKQAVDETWKRLLDPVKRMADTLASKDAIFRDSLVENIRDIVKLLPALNLTNNAQLSSAAKEVQDRLANFNADTLRENKTVRKAAAEAAAAIVNRFGNLGSGRKFAA